MKNLFFLPIMLILLLASCQKENENLNLFRIDHKMDTEEYLKLFPDAHIEYTNIEDLNKLYGKFGLPEVTLEELEITHEEYILAQERIKSDIDLRCTGWHLNVVRMGDLNLNGSFSTLDLILAQRVING